MKGSGFVRYIRLLPKFSLLIIVLVAVVVFSAFTTVSLVASRAFRDQEARAISSYHERLGKYVNDHINSMSNAALLFLSRGIPVGGVGEIETNIDKKTTLVKNLQVLFDTYPGIHSVYFYSGSEGKVLFYASGALKIFPFDMFYDMEFYQSILERDTFSFLSGMRSIPANIRDIGRAVPRSEAIVVSAAKRLPLRGDTQDVMVANIEASFFHGLMSSSNLPEDSIVLVSDLSGSSLISYRTDGAYDEIDENAYQDVYAQAYRDGELYSGFTCSLEDSAFYVSTSLEHKNRIYYTLVPETALTFAYSRVNMIMILVELIILGVGVCLAIYLSSTITRPLGDMIGRLEGEMGNDFPKSIISYPALSRMSEQISDIVVRSREQEATLAKYFRTYRESILLAILSGGRRIDDMPEGEMAISVGYAAYQVVACRFFPPGDAELNRANRESFADHAAERLGTLGQAERVTVSSSEIVFVLSLREMSEALSEQLRVILEEALEEKRFSGAAVFAIGKAYPTPEDLSLSYRYASAIYGSETYPRDAVLAGPYAPSTPRQTHATVNRQQDAVIEAVYDGDLERALSEINVLFALMRKEGFSLERLRKHSLILMFNLSPDSFYSDRYLADSAREALNAGSTADEMRDWIIGEVSRILPIRNEDAIPDARNMELIERVKSYIADHYGEDISLNVIADYVYFTPQYLGKLFKEMTGTTFTSHLIRVRMEAAARLLLTTRQSVTAISEAVGYTNIQSFGRAFRAYYGCTPGDFRIRRGGLEGNKDTASK